MKKFKRFLKPLIIFLSLLIIIVRKPDAITNPQFWAEDGIYWYGQAYNSTWLNALFIPITGYYQTISRIGGAITQLLPLEYVPLVFNLIAIFCLLSPIIILISEDVKKVYSNSFQQFFLIANYLILPNTSEIYINLTNAQWSLALTSLLALLLLRTNSYFLLKVLLFLVSGLSGPFSIMLTPVAYFRFRNNFTKKNLILFLIILITGLIQILTFVTVKDRHSNFPSEVSLTLLFGIISKQIIWGSLVGPNGYQWIIDKIPFSNFFLIISTVTAIAAVIYAFFKGPKEIKLMLVFATELLVASLFFPVIGNNLGYSPWQYLFNEWGTRYWFIPMVIFLFTLTWVATTKKSNRMMKFMASFFLLFMILFQIKNYRHYHNFKYAPYPDLQFQSHVDEFNKAKKGEAITIPINPLVDKWQLILIKH